MDLIYSFCEKHRILKLDVQYRNDSDLSKFGIPHPNSRSATVKLEIDQSELHNMIELEHNADKMHKELLRNSRTREECPAVQRAYEHYQLLLTLAQKEEDAQ